MANVYMPYNVAGQQQALLEGLLGSKQAQKQSQFDIGQQKGEMSEEFQKEAIAAQKKQEEILERQRGGKLWEKLLPIASMFGGPIASGVLGGLQGMYGMGKESKFAKARIRSKFNSGIIEDKIDAMNYLLNNNEFIDYYADYLKNFKIKVKVLNNINDFLLQQIINNDINIETISTINNNIITKFDEDIANSYKIIEDYISKILASECIEFSVYLNSLFQ